MAVKKKTKRAPTPYEVQASLKKQLKESTELLGEMAIKFGELHQSVKPLIDFISTGGNIGINQKVANEYVGLLTQARAALGLGGTPRRMGELLVEKKSRPDLNDPCPVHGASCGAH
jgi:hypothetical protein